MLKIVVPAVDYFDDDKNEFIVAPAFELELEHSLVSLSKWESQWEIPFLSNTEKTDAQTISYIRHMTLTPEVPPEVFARITDEQIEEINQYITAKMTATWFRETNDKPSREIITAEIIYHWLVSLNIPFECQDWHLNRLLALIKVCNQKNSPPKKMSKADLAARNRQLNEERKAKHKTRG